MLLSNQTSQPTLTTELIKMRNWRMTVFNHTSSVGRKNNGNAQLYIVDISQQVVSNSTNSMLNQQFYLFFQRRVKNLMILFYYTQNCIGFLEGGQGTFITLIFDDSLLSCFTINSLLKVCKLGLLIDHHSTGNVPGFISGQN